MSENCNQNCSSCEENCDERTENQKDFTVQANEFSQIKRVIAVVSGKGGVGKSLVSSMLAVTMQRRGHRIAILDADITGPSVPKAFGIHEKAVGDEYGMLPIKSKSGMPQLLIFLSLKRRDNTSFIFA